MLNKCKLTLQSSNKNRKYNGVAKFCQKKKRKRKLIYKNINKSVYCYECNYLVYLSAKFLKYGRFFKTNFKNCYFENFANIQKILLYINYILKDKKITRYDVKYIIQY